MSDQTSSIRCLTDAELDDVSGGLIDSATMAAMHYAFTAAALSDVLMGGFAADAAMRAAAAYRPH
jgi:hypothetical protein